MPKARRDILQTFHGKVIDIDEPKASMIQIEDIARGLANQKRFTGQTDETVAIHSIKAAREAKASGRGPRAQLYALLHDAAEAYYGDMPSPLKLKIKSFKKYENKLLNVILEKFLGESKLAKLPEWLKEIDDALLERERNYWFQSGMPWLFPVELSSIEIRCQFLNLFNDLYRQINLEGGENVRTERLR